jgi:ribosomal protein S18 acetylase RimI-like enzyme
MTATSKKAVKLGKTDYRIVPAGIGDIPAMTALLGLLFRLESDFMPDPRKQQEGLRLLLHSPTASAWVARTTEQVVGMVTLQTVVSTAEGGKAAVLEDLIVAPAFRRNGIGRTLVNTVLDYAQANGIRRIQLLADVHNVGAIIFYRALDWKQTNLVALRRLIMPAG